MVNMTQVTVHDALLADIERTGYYPALVAEALDAAIASEPIVGFFVHHEPTFDHDEIRRHMTCLVLTPSRFLLSHTDEHPADDIVATPYASTSVETVNLSRVSNVMVTRVVADPAAYRRGDAVHEVVLSLGWGAVGRVELEPAGCNDPNCEADHGYTGSVGNEDFTIRVSAAAEGPHAVAGLLGFVKTLSARTSGTGSVTSRTSGS
jgi:Family of unknown function (DUF5998)